MTSAPIWLRPIHRWFFLWEDLVPSVYRVLAVGVAGVASAVALAAIGIPPVIGVPAAVATWVAIAVVQEHDERVTLPVDAEFERQLRTRLDPPLAARGFAYNGASGPCRARRERNETFLYEAPRPPDGCIDLWIHRDRARGTMSVALPGGDLASLLAAAGDGELADRIGRVGAAEADVEAIVAAIAAAPEHLWR